MVDPEADLRSILKTPNNAGAEKWPQYDLIHQNYMASEMK